MKRLLPVVIFFCLLGAVISCLPKNNAGKDFPATLNDLNGRTVGVQTGLNYDLELAAKCPDAQISFFNDYTVMISAVMNGKLDTYLTESNTFKMESKAYPGLTALYDDPVLKVDVNIGVSKKGNGQVIMNQFNEFLTKIKADGTYDAMQDYWFENFDEDTCRVDKSGITGEKGVLRATAEAAYVPFCYVGEDGELQGYDVDTIYRFCRAYGYRPEIDPMEFDAMSAALASGKYNVAMGLIADEERSQEVWFTQPYSAYNVIAAFYGGEKTEQGFFEQVRDSFNKTFIKDNRWQLFASGAGLTLLISFLSAIFGTLLGFMLYLWCSHGKKTEKRFTDLLCWLMGSTPTVVMLMIMYYVVFGSLQISNVAVSVIGFSLLFGCSVYKLIVSGVKAVGKGQEEAARAQGFSADQTFFHIILPQAAAHFLPGYKSELIYMIQDTSVVGYIAVMDLTKMSDLVRGRTYEAFFPLLATAAIYFLVIWLLTWLVGRVQLKNNWRHRKQESILHGIKK